eukprot:CAMPEP_0179082604 /NCGR_PEP_ID=MMETSP0796-20121207/37254_1 /TAXON_ID=73915 /ORGANISM="Pyrodinium bahamense, Strain pbaha01" /LENGTH=849 /DNA_ID=CAMNT_0020779997 /DNA_START=36 /DNA_END=2585 /DNA_ORIENTATION=+
MPKNEFDDMVRKIFDLADANHSGWIEFGNFLAHHEKLSSAVAALPSVDYTETESNFRSLDRDHDGKLDREEFSAYMESLLAVLGGRSFRNSCEELIQNSLVQEDFDRRFTERLLEQARNTNWYLPEIQVRAEGFLAQKADPNFVDDQGSHALLHAAGKADADFIRRLVECRANPMLHNKAMDCAAFAAARVRNLDVLSLLLLPDAPESSVGLERKASQELVRDMSAMTEQSLQGLLSRRADVNFKDQFGWTPLTAAVFFGNKEVLDALLSPRRAPLVHCKKLHVNSWNGQGRAALHIAARKGHFDLILPLVRARGDPDAQDIDGWTPLHHATFNGKNEVISVLLEASADAAIRGRSGQTPFQVARLPSCAGELSESTRKVLAPPEEVDFAKKILPVLKDEDLTTYEKLVALLELPGVCQNARNLRLHDQFFDPRLGPNKVRLRKFWELLASPLVRRMQSGECDLSPPRPSMVEEEIGDRKLQIGFRQKEQQQFLHHWLMATKGLRPSREWQFDNRVDYGDQLQRVVSVELANFQKELDDLYQKTLVLEGGEELAALPEEEILREEYQTQLAAHPIPLWVEQLDPAGAFEALRLVGANGMGRDDDAALLSFMDLVTVGHDFDTGKSFWRNVYRLWLSEYAKAADLEFHRAIRTIVDRFNTLNGPVGMTATYRQGPVKSYEQIKVKEFEFGECSAETYEGRTLASKILDVVRGSIVVNCPQAVLVLLEDFFRPLADARHGRLKLARVVNRFSSTARTFHGCRKVELNLLFDGGQVPGRCGRPGAYMPLSLLGEVQINLEKFMAVRKRWHLLYKCSCGEFDWGPQEPEDEGDADGNFLSRNHYSLGVDDHLP